MLSRGVDSVISYLVFLHPVTELWGTCYQPLQSLQQALPLWLPWKPGSKVVLNGVTKMTMTWQLSLMEKPGLNLPLTNPSGSPLWSPHSGSPCI